MTKKLLFVCTDGTDLSPTAASVYNKIRGYKARSAGTDRRAKKKLNQTLINWADTIFVMTKIHKRIIIKRFPDVHRGKIKILNIPDRYERGSPALVKQITKRMNYFLRGY